MITDLVMIFNCLSDLMPKDIIFMDEKFLVILFQNAAYILFYFCQVVSPAGS